MKIFTASKSQLRNQYSIEMASKVSLTFVYRRKKKTQQNRDLTCFAIRLAPPHWTRDGTRYEFYKSQGKYVKEGMAMQLIRFCDINETPFIFIWDLDLCDVPKIGQI